MYISDFKGLKYDPEKARELVKKSGYQGQTIGIVGESGCGKSTAAKIIVNIDRPTSGQVFFMGESIAGALPDLRRRLTRSIQYVFQDPLGALDPRMDIIGQVMEPYAIHGLYSNGERRDRAAVMYLGKIVEMADNDDLFNQPAHPYTQALLSAVPIPEPRAKQRRIMLNGDPPSPINPPSGCRFHPRCRLAQTIRRETEPPVTPISPSS